MLFDAVRVCNGQNGALPIESQVAQPLFGAPASCTGRVNGHEMSGQL